MHRDDFIQIKASNRLVKICVFLFPILALVFFALLRYGDRHFYLFLTYEDHLLEIISAIVYFCSMVLAVLAASAALRDGQKFNGIMYCLFAFAMFLIFGEEISWGQRVFGIESPEYFMENSSQQEINFHNLKPVQAILHSVYIALGLLGGLLWIIAAFTKSNSLLFNKSLIPGWYLMLYFLPVALFYFGYDHLGLAETPNGLMGRDQEVGEVLMCLGFFLFIFISLKRLKKRPANESMSGLSLDWYTVKGN